MSYSLISIVLNSSCDLPGLYMPRHFVITQVFSVILIIMLFCFQDLLRANSRPHGSLKAQLLENCYSLVCPGTKNIPNDALKIQKFRSSRPHDISALTKIVILLICLHGRLFFIIFRMRSIAEFIKPNKIHLLHVLLSNPVLNIGTGFS